ncbi:MAG: hypothetical protein LBQ57_09935 [Spirochaetales bacterium]|jgi:GMP synthase-like glutamine amidotransferase/predicted Fe-Mo cluster-binding NifX family protein|nr:hypothetical protein [Spirochaetales bacterium]
MRIHYIQHAPSETPGVILDWAREKGHRLTQTLTYSDNMPEAAFPSPESFDWLVIMGGAMNVYEEADYLWLVDEKVFIKKAVDAGKTVLGLCLGAQLLAVVLGGKVTKNPRKEIGWFPVTLTPEGRELPILSFLPRQFPVFQWHGDTFSILPGGAIPLAESAACKNQGFVYGDRVFAFQFHWENTRETIQEFISSGADELVPAEYVQTPEELLAHPEYIKQNNEWMREFLDRLEAKTEKKTLLFAAASKDGKLVDTHFGHATRFYIYEYSGGNVSFKEFRDVPQYCAPEEKEKAGALDLILETIRDCACVLTVRIGEPPRRALERKGIKVLMTYNPIEEAVREAAEKMR